MINMKTVGFRLRSARQKKGWTQTYVCKKLGISNSTLSGYERDYRKPDPEQLRDLAILYEVSTDYLLCRTDDPKPETEKLTKEELAEIKAIADGKIKLVINGESLDPEDEKMALGIFKSIYERAKARLENDD